MTIRMTLLETKYVRLVCVIDYSCVNAVKIAWYRQQIQPMPQTSHGTK